jgi:hypothetical protein
MPNLTPKINAEITTAIKEAKKAGVLVPVYAVAEAIRLANVSENIALEDIVQAVITHAADGPGYEADPYEARDALLGETTHRFH